MLFLQASNKDKPANYGPVTLTIVIGILLKIIGDENYSRDCQYGFVQGRSYLTNLIELFEETIYLVKDRAGIAVSMDFCNVASWYTVSKICSVMEDRTMVALCFFLTGGLQPLVFPQDHC